MSVPIQKGSLRSASPPVEVSGGEADRYDPKEIAIHYHRYPLRAGRRWIQRLTLLVLFWVWR
jgi:hypothetical protein